MHRKPVRFGNGDADKGSVHSFSVQMVNELVADTFFQLQID
jgi:hypothetical protein